MTLEIRQMVIRSELSGNAGTSAQSASAGGNTNSDTDNSDEGDNCCAADENASNKHREARNLLRTLRVQMASLRER
ncbi:MULTISPECIES: hypothetical protein [unclassified Cupriavidus]|uniref:hypothetical protein n=1 Tax=unclassified Cupriavidus TaxID=2640874 RepID=UPI00136582C7|nr:hypothetical protein [Cupriavidus sp. SW-Y-13]MWL89299.1 hypothetical protein [Cupriavidus sp. SW-Y-13]